MKKYCALIISLSVTLLPIPSFAEIYQYKNAAGRIVSTTKLPPGMKPYKEQGSSSHVHDISILDFCKRKWENDFEMIEYCVKKQFKGKAKLQRYPVDIVQFCADKWENDYEMTAYCSERQYLAQKRLGN